MSMNDDLKINFDKVGKACKQVGEEMKKMMKENDPFDTISKIAKDIVDRQDREIALKFAKCICELLKKNGVTPMIDEYNHQDVKENSVEYKYGVSITGLDFTEHDKPFERRIKKLESLRCRCHESARDSFDNGNYGILHIVTADEIKTSNSSTDSETDRLVKLPFDAMETANVLINATYKADMPFLEKKYDRNLYDIDDLEQIAEHLLVYCKHNREDDE